MALRQALTVRTDDQWNMDIADRWQAEQPLQKHLSGGRRQEVVTTDHVVHPLLGVVDDARQVVRRHAVVASQHDVVHRTGEWTGEGVVDRDRRFRRPQPQRRRTLPAALLALGVAEVAADPRIGAIGPVRGGDRVADLPPGAVALVRETGRAEPVDRRVVGGEALALADHGPVPVDPEGRAGRRVGGPRCPPRSWPGRGPRRGRRTGGRPTSGRRATPAALFAGCRHAVARSATERIVRSRAAVSGVA